MRTGDQAIPTITGPRPPRPAGWLADLWVAVERLPTTAYHWDDYQASWDAPGARFQWDDWTDEDALIDATCDVAGLELETGAPDAEGRIDAGRVVMTLRNDDGQWSQYDTFGRLTAYEPGSRLAVWATIAGPAWWLFDGKVASWREQVDGTVEVEAFDVTAEFNTGLGEWQPGTYGQTPHNRIGAILDLVGYTGPRRLDVGANTLHAYTSTATPLEEMQSVALSDGGFVGCDADGTWLFRNRGWPGGRADQPVIRKFSDNVCGVQSIVWDLELVTDDEVMVTDARLENVAKVAVVSSTPAGARHRYDRTGDQWITVGEGQALADGIVARRSGAYLRLDGFTLHLHDPTQNLWREGIDLRLGDLVRFVHDHPAVDGTLARFDLNLVVQALRHAITPTEWTVAVATTRAVGNNVTYRWDSPVRWDTPPAVWGE